MKNDVQFRNRLVVQYLKQLIQGNHRETFEEYFPQVEDYLKDRVQNSNSKEEILDIQRILEFQQSKKVMEM